MYSIFLFHSFKMPSKNKKQGSIFLDECFLWIELQNYTILHLNGIM